MMMQREREKDGEWWCFLSLRLPGCQRLSAPPFSHLLTSLHPLGRVTLPLPRHRLSHLRRPSPAIRLHDNLQVDYWGFHTDGCFSISDDYQCIIYVHHNRRV